MLAKSALVSLLVATFAAAISFQTPDELVECQEVELHFGEGAPNYLVAAVNADEPCGLAYHEFPETKETTLKWVVNVPEGTRVQFVAEDSQAAEAWSGGVVVKAGSDKSCLPASPTTSTEPPASTTAPPSSTFVAPKPPVVKPSNDVIANAGAGPQSSASPQPSNGASHVVVSSGAFLGLVGAVAMLL
jgi:hypothetical protein